MSVEVLDAATIFNFVDDEEAFEISVCDRFAHLDTNHDGLLSYVEMLKELQCLRVFETHFGIDVKPDPDELAVSMIPCSCSSIMTLMGRSIWWSSRRKPRE
ncbi:hypothetical protein I3842_03G099000 [Carya illinoinensis]|uniref:EF-hand domain-containing protein n=1 Tax=Carya illinoinensis TaxID=32201 RepID=A0A922FJ58_CARIL|nr:hypothetical protein I3842_03G099000 [Carya illinoinensis]